MPRLHILIDSLERQSQQGPFELLLKAAKHLQVELLVHESSKADFVSLPKVKTGDLLYTKSVDRTTARLEQLLLSDDLSTFYTAKEYAQTNQIPWLQEIIMLRKNLSIIPTVFHLDFSKPNQIQKAVDSLGGFPVVLKIDSLSHGRGLFLFEDLQSLVSAAPDFEQYTTQELLGLKRYIPHTSHARLIVIGDQVIDSIEYLRQGNDFRTNSSASPAVQPKKFDAKTEKLAIEATAALGLEFGGVDIIIDETDGTPYIAEVNFPCNFARSQNVTSVDVAGAMIEFLLKKSNRILASK